MPIERVFLGWDEPVTIKVRKFLLPGPLHGPVDMGRDLIVVPTRQAGRSLRETLARYSRDQNSALLSPCVETPAYFTRVDPGVPNLTSITMELAIWTKVFLELEINQYRGLFPAPPPEQDFAWALRAARMVQDLRQTLMDGGYLLADVQTVKGDPLPELERWRDLARLESAYFQRLKKLGLTDRTQHLMAGAAHPQLPEGLERIVVAVVPDPAQLMVRGLELLARRLSVIILIHAPASLQDHFDEWGRPLSTRWRQAILEIPDEDENIILAGTPAAQSRRVLELIHQEAGRFGPEDLAVGVPDPEIIPLLMARLAEEGLPAFDPAGRPLRDHPLFQLLQAWIEWIATPDYPAFSALLRRYELLELFKTQPGISAESLLTELDQFQNEHVPQDMDDVLHHLDTRPAAYPGLRLVVNQLQVLRAEFERLDIQQGVAFFLQSVFASRQIHPGRPADDHFLAVAGRLNAALAELAEEPYTRLELNKTQWLALLMKIVAEQVYYPDAGDAVLGLEGWLELPWNDAPFLMVTGLNDEFVPGGRLGDQFLPDSLRTRLKLRTDADRFARDACLLRGLIEARRDRGRTCLLVGKTSGSGDPLRPSRLLFCCDEAALARRAERLFDKPVERGDNPVPDISFRLDPARPLEESRDPMQIRKLDVTVLKDYLRCPFRFYLSHILEMAPLDDTKAELDALDFGSLIHDVLRRLAEDPELCSARNETKLSRRLSALAEDWVRTRFGSSPALPIQIQLESARQRLGAFACQHVELNKEGWSLVAAESKFEMEVQGVLIRGKIDRVDRHGPTGRIRLLDYKTSEKAEDPQKIHLATARDDMAGYARVQVGGKNLRWTDMQLPGYRLLLQSARPEWLTDDLDVGYFNLPNTAAETGVTIWPDFSPDLLDSARQCLAGIVTDVLAGRFWPPVERVPHEDYDRLYFGRISDYFDAEFLPEQVKGSRA